MKWFRRLLLLLLILLPLSLSWLLGSESAARWLLTGVLPGYLPQLQIGVVGGNLWRGLSLQQIAYRDGQLQLQLDSLDSHWSVDSVLQGKWVIQRLALGRMELQLPADSAADAASEPQGLPITLVVQDFSLEQLRIKQGEQQWQIRQAAAMFSVDPMLRLEQLKVALPDFAIQLSVRGELDLADPALNHDLTLEWQGDLPGVGPARGKARVRGSLARVKLQHSLLRPFSVETAGDLLLGGARPELDLQGEWRDLHWPLQGEVQVGSRAGNYRLTGPLGALQLVADGELEPTGYPGGSWKLLAQIEDSDALINSLTLDSTAGHLQLQGDVDWKTAPAWRFTFAGSELDPASIAPEWSGRLQLSGSSRGRLIGTAVEGVMALDQLKGELRGYPLTANARMKFAPNRVQLGQLQLDSGGNRLQAKGLVYPRLDLNTTLEAADLAALWPGLAGQAQGEFQVAGDPENPSIDGRMSAQGLAYEEPGAGADARLGVEKLQLELNWSPGESKASTSVAHLFQLQTPSGNWQEATAELSGNTTAHRLRLALSGGPLDLEALLQGGVSVNGTGWAGQLLQLRLSPAKGERWESAAPAQLQLSRQQLSLAPFCLRQGTAELCGGAQWQQKSGVVADLKLRDLALQSLSPWLPSNFRLEGTLDGTARVEGDPANPSAHAQLLPGSGLLLIPDAGEGPPLQIAYSQARVVVDLADQALSADAGFVLQGRGKAELQLSLAAPDKQERRALAGSLKADFPDLNLLGGFVPNARISSGSLHLDGRLSGDLQQPRLHGGLRVENGTLDYPDLGVRFEALNLVAESDRPDRLRVEGSTRSGEGELRLEGEIGLDARAGWPTRLNLRGERVRLVRLPEARVLASPDLTLRGNREGLEVTGKVVLPEVAVEVRELPQGAVQVSEDEEIVGGPSTDTPAKKRSVPIKGDIELQLGDAVKLSGFGLKTRLSGGLKLTFEPGRNEAQGTIDLLEGQYKAYGQDLTLERGKLIFSGPVDNPGVDLRARRTSSDGEVKAYLELSGTLRKPSTSIRTEPPSSSTDALSYLLTGGPMSQSSGVDSARLLQAAGSLGLSKSLPALQALRQSSGLDELGIKSGGGLEGAALVGGKYLTPDLYVSYAQGLFNPDGALSLKYRLSERFSVESRSGTEQSIDLIYSFERD